MKNYNEKLKINKEYVGWRLDKLLKEKYSELSRSYIQKSIEASQVLVNGGKVVPHYFLKIGDTVEIKMESPKEIIVEPNQAVQFGVIAEEKGFLIINKPPGIVVHQGEGHKEPDTLVNGLLSHYPEIAKVGEDPLRPGIVHRLDAEASGVMIVARSQEMFDHLKGQFSARGGCAFGAKEHKVKKEYIAIVHGKVSPPSGVIEFAIGRRGAKMVARPKPPLHLPLSKGEKEEVKRAITEYETIRSIDRFTLLHIRTYTGRTHQIRVHFFALGHPIVGDLLYKLQIKNKKLKIKPERLMLHAQKLGFYDLEGKWREYEAPIPNEFGIDYWAGLHRL